ncbi:MAG: TonB-dependent receptor [Reichenbachiella sp.]|uniref:TonB-dependent receptor plug domain-containing protein n=1 Tax=Reichenbachiella sp. TaxID=2184521 RepID=UPI0032631E88
MRVLKINLKNLCVIGAFLMTGFWASAQEEELSTISLDEVVVTGTKFEIPVEKSGKSIYKLTAKDIEQNAGKSVADLLNEVPGIQMDGNFGAPGTNISYFVRGGRNKNTLILVDGVPLNDPSGIDASFDLRFLPVGQIESIEVLKGGLSTLYGTGASAAVINIKLKEAASDGTHGQVDYSFGSYKTHQLSANVNGTQDKLSYAVSGGFMDAEGFSAASDENSTIDFQKDGMDQKNGALKLGLQVTDQLNLGFNAGYNEFSADYDGSAFVDAENQNNSNQFRVGITPTYNYGSGNVKVNLLLNTGTREFISSFPSEYKSKNLQTEITHEHQVTEQIKTLIGINYQKLSAKQVVEPDTGYDDFNLVDPFASVFFDHSSGFNVHAGVRLNTHSEYGSEFVYNINPSYQLFIDQDVTIKLLGSISTSYITPSLYQLYSIYGNTDLKPETSTNYEGGLSFYLGKSLELNTVYFRRDENDPIQFESLFDSDGNWIGGIYNNTTSERVVKGLEVDARWSVNEKINLRTNYAYVTTDDETTFYRIPNVKLGASVTMALIESLDVSLKYNYTGERTIFDFGSFSEIDLKAYSLVDLFANYKLMDQNLSIYGGINNILDEDFDGIYGFTSRGRNTTVGLNYKF